MKKILVASPVKSGCSINYIKSIIMLHFCTANKIIGGPNAPFDFRWGATTGTAVNLARDELASLAMRDNFDGILWFDIDLGSIDDQMMFDMFMRLLSHIDHVDGGIVAGQYVGHKFISQWHGATMDGEPAPREDGLMEMAQVPLGFSYMPIAALEKIRAANPWRRYQFLETGMVKTKDMFEFFPIGIAGPCSSEGKLARLRAIVGKAPSTVASFEAMDEIAKIVWDDRYESNIQLGEDYYFCRLARESGVKLYIDNNLIIPHESNVRLPVRNQDMIAEIGHEWRLANDAKPEQVAELLKQLTPLLSKDMP